MKTALLPVSTFSLLAVALVAGCNTPAPDAAIAPLTMSSPKPAASVMEIKPDEKPTGASATGVPILKNPPDATPFGDLVALSGKKVSLDALKGKVIVLDFWATWCGPCRMTIPMLKELQDKYGKDGLEVVGISDETEAQVKPFAEQMGMNYNVVADPKTSETWQQNYGVSSLPTMVVIDRKGKVRLYEKGVDPTPGKGTEDRLNELIPQLVAEK